MPRYELTLAFDVPCYRTFVVEAETPEEAIRIAKERANNEGAFQPEWASD